MDELHINSIDKNFVPEEGHRNLMCSNKESIRYPSSGITNTNHSSEDVALDYLAGILVEAFLDKKNSDEQRK